MRQFISSKTQKPATKEAEKGQSPAYYIEALKQIYVELNTEDTLQTRTLHLIGTLTRTVTGQSKMQMDLKELLVNLKVCCTRQTVQYVLCS
jgi:hypothetical protein